MSHTYTWRDNAGLGSMRASEFFSETPRAAGGEYRLTVWPAAYAKTGGRKRGSKWCCAVSAAYESGVSRCFTVERVGRDAYDNRLDSARDAMRAAEMILNTYLESARN